MKLTRWEKQALLDTIPEGSIFHFVEEGIVQDVVLFKAYVAEVLKWKIDAEDMALLDWIKRVVGNTYVWINISWGKVSWFDNMQREYEVWEEVETIAIQ